MRAFEGKGLYVEPSINFVPQLYTPLYFYVGAAVAKIVGPGLFALRLISFISSLLCLAIIWRIVYNETRNHLIAFVCACLFAATYRATGAWFDLGRVDSFFLALLLAGIYLVRFRTSWQAYALAGVFFALSFLTKQSALFMCAPVVLYCLWVNWRRALVLAASLALIAGGSTLLLNVASGGWFLYYVFEVPSRHPWIKPMLLAFWRDDLLGTFPLAIACIVVYLVAALRPRHPSAFWVAVLLGALAGSFLTRVKEGSDYNVMLPTYAAIIVLFGMALDLFFQRLRDMDAGVRKPLETLTYILCILQFLLFAYNPAAQLPTQADRQAGERLVEMIANTDGEVYVPFHGYLTTMAGKGSYAHSWAMEDILKTKTRGAPILKADISKALREHRFSLILMDDSLWVMSELDQYYTAIGPVFDQKEVFYPVAGGMRIRPETIYAPKLPPR
jgi:hypothetical protein